LSDYGFRKKLRASSFMSSLAANRLPRSFFEIDKRQLSAAAVLYDKANL
jgi:hypothetical protein